MKRKNAKLLILCLVILYAVSFHSLLAMSRYNMLWLLEDNLESWASVVESRVLECEEKIKKGEMSKEEALCYITDTDTRIYNNNMSFLLICQLDEDGNETILSAQGEIKDYGDKTRVDVLFDYYNEDESLKFKKDVKNLEMFEDVDIYYTEISLGGEKYDCFISAVWNLNYVSLTQNTFIEHIALVTVAFAVLGAVMFFTLTKKKEN